MLRICNYQLQHEEHKHAILKTIQKINKASIFMTGGNYMLQNYDYFLTLAQELNISRAASKLYISHQCLSRYLKNLEDECGMPLFERKPKLALTYAGQVLLNAFLQIQRIELSTSHELAELKLGNFGEITVGITEGRLRILIPDLIKEYKKEYPSILIKTVSMPSPDMYKQLLDNKLDVVIAGIPTVSNPNLIHRIIMTEHLYLLISDNLLRQYFPDTYPSCKEVFEKGADLSLFQDVPFIANYPNFNSRRLLDNHLTEHQLTLNIIYEATQPDLLHMMAAQDYAATVCLTMYVPSVWELNQSNPPNNQLNIFPIKGLQAANPVALTTVRDRFFPKYVKSLFSILEKQCKYYSKIL